MDSDFPAKTLDANTALCLDALETGLESIGLQATVKKRGHFGNVRRFHFDLSTWFDALPAKSWILFYFSPAASRVVGLHFLQVRDVFAHAEERKDMIVKVRLQSLEEVKLMVELIRSALKSKKG